MPSWKKVVASGSDASFSSVSVDTFVSASSFKGSFTGSLQGTASQAISSSYALTASYALFAANGGGGGISAIYIQDEGITQGTASYFNFYGAGVTATVSDSTASINIPGGGGGTTNNASNAVLNQSSPAVTWSFSHNLGAKYPVFTVFDSNDNVIIPQQIKAVDTASALIYFSTARTGTAVASVAGNVLTSSYSISSSYAYTASSAVNSYTLNGTGSVGFATTASFNAVSSSQQQISASYIALSASYNTFSGSVSTRITTISSSQQDISSSLLQVSSSTQQVSASYIALSASYNVSSASLSTRVTANSASISSLNTVSGSFAVLAANQTFSGKNTFTSDITASNIRITGTASIQYLDVVFQSSSVIYASGSNQLGDASNDTQTLWGTVNVISGPLVVTGSANFKETITGSITSATNASTASYVLNAVSSSYAYTASSAIDSATLTGTGSVGFATTASLLAVSSSQQQISSSLLQVSSSYIALSGSYNIFSASISTRVTTISSSQQDISSSLLQVSASYISLSGSYNTSSGSFSTRLTTVSSSQQDISSSQQQISASLLIISRSYATTGSNNFTSNQTITGSLNVSGGITGSLQGTSSWAQNAISSSYALTASFALNGGGGGLSALYIADEGITQGTASYINFTGAGVTATVSAGTASINITGGGSSGTSGLSTTFTQSIAATEWTFIHNLNTRYPLIQVYDTTYNQIVPQFVSSSTADTVIIGFGVATAGYAVASSGGTLYVTGSNVILDQVAAATTWSFNHNLNTQYPIFQVFDSNNEVMIPQRIVATDATSSLFYFPTAVTGKAVASVGGISGSMGSGVGFPFSGSAVITGSFLVSQSFVDFSKTTGVTGSFTGSLFGTASYATFALSCSFAPGFTTNMSQSIAATTWSFTHNLNTINPIVQVYDLTNSQIVPNQIVGMNNSTAEIRFDYAQAGYAVASNGGGLYVTGSTSTLVQNSGAVTWSFTHNLNNKYNTYEVYDSNDTVIIPSGIKALTNNTAELYFSGLQTGRAVAQFSGINGAPNATTASYALTATSSSYAATASYLNPITNSYVVLTQVSQSLNYVDDVAAAAGGVPLGGIYRNGNFILIRLS